MQLVATNMITFFDYFSFSQKKVVDKAFFHLNRKDRHCVEMKIAPK